MKKAFPEREGNKNVALFIRPGPQWIQAVSYRIGLHNLLVRKYGSVDTVSHYKTRENLLILCVASDLDLKGIHDPADRRLGFADPDSNRFGG